MITYVCTWVEKTVCEDSYNDGVIGEQHCVMSESVIIKAETLPELIAKIGERYGLAMDDLFIPADPDKDIRYFGFNRLENNDGEEPCNEQMALFERGMGTLWLADYHFGIEKRIVKPLRITEFELAGIKIH